MPAKSSASLGKSGPVLETDPVLDGLFANDAEREAFKAELRERAKGPFISSEEVKRQLDARFAQERRRLAVRD